MNSTKIISYSITALISILAIAALFNSCTTILPGHAGIIFNQISGDLKSTGQGLIWKIPFVTTVQSYPVALRTYTMVQKNGEGSSATDDSVDLPTREGQHIKQDISVTYNTSLEKAGQVFTNFRGQDIEDIENTFIRRTIITVAQNAAGQMSLSELISQKRDELETVIQTHLLGELQKMGFKLDKVNLGASHLPKVIEEQMQNKMAAQQEAQKAEYELQKQSLLAKAHIAKANGDAQTKIISAKAEAESNSLLQKTMTPAIIQSKAIDKWNGSLPQIMGSGSVPFVNFSLASKKGNE